MTVPIKQIAKPQVTRTAKNPNTPAPEPDDYRAPLGLEEQELEASEVANLFPQLADDDPRFISMVELMHLEGKLRPGDEITIMQNPDDPLGLLDGRTRLRACR